MTASVMSHIHVDRPHASEPAGEGVEGSTCQHCGHVGSDVALRVEYVGGHGFEWRRYCEDRVACWARWSLAHPV